MLRHIIHKYTVRISKTCMDGFLLYGILVFLREVITHMLYIPITKQIQEDCFSFFFIFL